MKRILLICLIFFLGCGNNEIDEKYILPKEATRQSIIEMAIKYDAIADWENFEAKSSDGLYTIQLQRALKRAKAPYLLFVIIMDIVENDNKIYFHCYSLFDYETKLFVLLESDFPEEKLDKILQSPISEVMLYAIIAKIGSIKKPPLSIYGEPDEYGDYTDIELVIDITDTIILKGLCLDFTKSGYLSADEKGRIIEEIKSLQEDRDQPKKY